MPNEVSRYKKEYFTFKLLGNKIKEQLKKPTQKLRLFILFKGKLFITDIIPHLMYNSSVRYQFVALLLTISFQVLATEYSYKDHFKISMDNSTFTYKSKVKKFNMNVSSCNKSILSEITKSFTPKKQLIKLPTKLNSLFFIKEKKKIYFLSGSKTHTNLESMDRLIDSYISRVRNACKNE